MRIAAVSDLHGHLPEIPECDLLLLAGDICPAWDHRLDFQYDWLTTEFHEWMLSVPAKCILGTWGNHDWIGEKNPERVANLPWIMLTDRMTEQFGLRIYGTPWQRRFCDWAFNLDTPELDKKYKAVPECDIIIAHGPPHGYGDWVARGEHVGSEAFLKRIDEIEPKLVVFGHIHTSPGAWQRNGTILANVTLVNDGYRVAYPPRVFDI